MKHLILLTNTYPYGRGEEFFEAEVPFLAQHFDRVHLFATQVAPDAAQTRTPPPDVSLYPVRTPQFTRADRLAFLRMGAPRVAMNRRYLARALEGWRNPRRLAASAFFEARAQAIYARVAPLLDGLTIGAGDRVVVYSFWFHLTARVGELVRDALRAAHPGLDITFVSRAHGYDLYHEAGSLGFIPQRERLLAAVDAVYPVSTMGVRYLQERYPADANKVSVRRLGSREPDAEPAISRDRLYVTSCAFVTDVKRLDRFPAIVEKLAAEGIPVTWTHLGDGPGMASLRQRVAEVIELAEVKLLGYVANPAIFEAYAQHPSTVFLNLSASEGVPVSIMEALSCGLPVVATNVGGVPEIVREGESGYLLPADFTDDQVVAALRRVWQLDDASYAALSASARALWEQEFRAATNFARFAAEL